MKSSIFTIALLLITSFLCAQYENVPELCRGLSFDQRTVLAVSDFKVSAYDANSQSSIAMRDMLSNALLNSGCFRIAERTDLSNVLSEQALGLSGSVNANSATQTGNLTGAQVLVIGNLTEFKENESGIGIGAISRRLGGSVVGMTKAHIGFIIKLVDATTGEVLVQKSFEKKVKKVGGLGGTSLLGAIAGGGFFKSKAMSDAIEESIIESVQFIAAQKDVLPILKGGSVDPKSLEDCTIFNDGAPTVMVMIPEHHISRPVPDPAGETEIIRQFIEFGYDVLDPSQIIALQERNNIQEFISNPDKAAEFGRRFGSDIIIVGEAFSEFASNMNGGMVSCRARVEARAIDTKTGKILSTNGMHAGGTDLSEAVAGKQALKNAGGQMAQYFINSLCAMNMNISSTQQRTNKNSVATTYLDIQVSNMTFSNYRAIDNSLKQFDWIQVDSKKFDNKIVTLKISHTKTENDIADILIDAANLSIEITSLDSNKLTAVAN